MPNEWHSFSVGDPGTYFVERLEVALVDEEGQDVATPAGRPIGSLIVTAFHARTGPIRFRLMCNWQALAGLAGMLDAWRETLPLHVGDQYDAQRAMFLKAAREGIAGD